jgi:SpoVK/Ycf46/Vps4 family AAA+-type ATPase
MADTCQGIDEKRMEDELSKWFELAEIWGAVMLIDEVDVYLEKRQTGELQRNSLVSGRCKPDIRHDFVLMLTAFLRSMEYYRGILFLTTNRIGHIDDAIMSRVHLVLKYEPLNAAARRTIWSQFIEKLEGDREEFTVERRAKTYLLEIPYLHRTCDLDPSVAYSKSERC